MGHDKGMEQIDRQAAVEMDRPALAALPAGLELDGEVCASKILVLALNDLGVTALLFIIEGAQL